MSFNDDLVNNLIEYVKSTGANWSQNNGKVEFLTKPMEGSHPWRYVRHDPRTNCTLWKDLIYKYLCGRLLEKKDQFIPQGCQDCYKVVVRPRTYAELLDLEAIMIESGFCCKCGCETRHTVKGYYGGYFYNRGLEEGLEKLEAVRGLVKPEVPVFLKRGCTQFELKHGPSDKWQTTPLQVELEKEVERRVFINPDQQEQSEQDIKRVYELWRNYAWKLDPTYTGKELYPKYVTYGEI